MGLLCGDDGLLGGRRSRLELRQVPGAAAVEVLRGARRGVGEIVGCAGGAALEVLDVP
jgi:hypothetical protein